MIYQFIIHGDLNSQFNLITTHGDLNSLLYHIITHGDEAGSEVFCIHHACSLLQEPTRDKQRQVVVERKMKSERGWEEYK